MQEAAQAKRSTLLPLIRYREPERAIEWLGKAFGLETRCVAKRADGSFAYAHVAFGDDLIMVTPARETGSDALQKLPADAGKRAAQGCYFVVEDVEAHFARAKDAGAKVVLDIKPYEHGGSRYSCRDFEGHVWTFGTYDPWRNKALAAPARAKVLSAWQHRAGLAAAATLTAIALAVPAWRFQATPRAPLAATPAASASTQAPETVAHVEASATEALPQRREEPPASDAAGEPQRTAPAKPAQEQEARPEPERLDERLEAETSPPARAAAEEIVRDLDDHLKQNSQAALAAGSDPAPAQSSPEAPVPVAAVSNAPPPPDPEAGASPPSAAPSNPLLAEGQAAMAKGDIEGARRHFARLAEQGVPEAALALGSTYDPASIERAGMASAQADRARAKQWYRRAIELAQAAAERHAPK
jgi:uncharacterized glyoxalase superfamily protein PhnB